MPTDVLPPTSIWERYPEIAIAVLFIAGILAILALVWREARKSLKEQSTERAEEREKQRKFEAEQNKYREDEQTKRDAMWRQFFEQIQARQEAQTASTNAALGEISKQVNTLTLEIRSHDIWAREAVGSDAPKEKRRPARPAT